MNVAFEKFLSSRANLIESSPLRVAVSKAAELASRGIKAISLAAGDPDPDVIPRKLLADLMYEVLSDPRSVLYSPPQGYPDVIKAVSKYYSEVYNISVDPSDILVTTGGQQALDIIPRVLCGTGDAVVLENPSYINAILCFKHYSVQLYGVPIDENGMRVDRLDELMKKLISDGKRVKYVYTISIGQNPSGVSLTYERGKYLLELASKYDFLILEDAAYSPLQYDGNVKPLLGLDAEGRVIHIGTASKILGTGWRIGWLIAKGPVFDKSLHAKMPMDMCAPSPSQLLFSKVVEKGLIRDVISTACRAYKDKRDAMLRALEEGLPDLKFTRPIAGMFIMLWLPARVDGWDFFNKLADKHHVIVVPAAPFFLDNGGRNAIRLNFSRPNINDIPIAIERMRQLLKEEYAT